jgi:hypothetical protein
MSDQDAQTRLRNVPPNRWLTYAFLLALGLAVFFVWFIFRGREGRAADPTPTPTATSVAAPVATMTPTFRPLIVLTAPLTPVPTATAVPSAVVVPVIVLPPLPTETPAPTETPTAHPSMVQRGEIPTTGRST